MAGQRPLFGWGWDSTPFFYEQIGERLERDRLPRNLKQEYSSNDWLRLLAETGWIGFLAFTGLLLYLGRHLFSRGFGENPLRMMLAAGAVAGFLLVFTSPLLGNTAFLTPWLILLGFGAQLSKIEKARRRQLHDSED